MKKIFGYIFAALLLGACSISTDSNGKLDGFWHLTTIDTLATGGVTDYSQRKVFWGVQAKLISVQDKDIGHSGYYFRFKHEGDSLIINSPYLNGGHEDMPGGGDIPINDYFELMPLGINGLEEHFVIEKLTGSHMTLRSKLLRLNFRRF